MNQVYPASKKEAGRMLSRLQEAVTFDDVQLVPKLSDIESRGLVSTSTAFTRNFDIDVPLISAPMDSVCELEMAKVLWEIGAVGCIHRFMTIDEQRLMVEQLFLHIHSFQKTNGKLDGFRSNTPVVCAAIGANGDSFERARALIDAGANVLVIDVAHGHHENVRKMLDKLVNYRETLRDFTVNFVAGNIATAEAAVDLELWGADALRVGIGGGSVCETRIRTGIGVPQLTAIDEITAVTDLPVISDGGIRYPGDVAKALAAGATTVMIGSLLAGTDEAPGQVFVSGKWPNNSQFKMYRGSASASIKMEKTNGAAKHVEGAAKMVECKGPAVNVISDIMDGVTSAMSYLGVDSVEDIWSAAEFVKISSAGLREAHPHLLG